MFASLQNVRRGGDRAVGYPASAAHLLADFLDGQVAARVVAEGFQMGERRHESLLAVAQLQVGRDRGVEGN